MEYTEQEKQELAALEAAEQGDKQPPVDENSTEVGVILPPTTRFVLKNTNPPGISWLEEVREALAKHVAPIVEAHIGDMVQSKGEALTTKQDSIALGTESGERMIINFSANYWSPKGKAVTKETSKNGTVAGYELTKREVDALPVLIAQAAQGNDAATAAKLMSIREVHGLVGKVSFEQLAIVKSLVKG